MPIEKTLLTPLHTGSPRHAEVPARLDGSDLHRRRNVLDATPAGQFPVHRKYIRFYLSYNIVWSSQDDMVVVGNMDLPEVGYLSGSTEDVDLVWQDVLFDEQGADGGLKV